MLYFETAAKMPILWICYSYVNVNLNRNDDLCHSYMIQAVFMFLCVVAVLCLLHTYVVFPLWMRLLLFFSSKESKITYMAASANAIMVGPEIVLPGRK